MRAPTEARSLPARLFADRVVDVASDEASVARVVIWERLLENGTRHDLRSWLSGMDAEASASELTAWLRARGDRLSARSWAFWAWLLDAAIDGGDLRPRGDNPYWPDAAGRAADDREDGA